MLDSRGVGFQHQGAQLSARIQLYYAIVTLESNLLVSEHFGCRWIRTLLNSMLVRFQFIQYCAMVGFQLSLDSRGFDSNDAEHYRQLESNSTP